MDAECRFVKCWVPELRGVPPEAIINNHDTLLPHYPPPVVDFGTRTQQMKDILYGIRKTQAATDATQAVYLKHGSRKKELARKSRPPKKPKGNPNQLFLFD